MTVDITQDEMNILNLNGISTEDVRANVEFLRATGMDDNTIRQQFSNTIEKLKPITNVSVNDTGKIKEWQKKGGITPFELGQRKGVIFDGTYSNIDNSANLSRIEQKLKDSAYNDKVEQRIQAAKNQKAERNKRVNEGTASFFDRAGAALDRMGQASYQAQLNTSDDITSRMAGVNKQSEPRTGEINFAEALGNSFMTGSWLPFVGGYIGSADTQKERAIEEKIRNGKPIRQDELNFINHRIEQRKEESVRGYTWGGQVADSFLPSLVRFGGEIATGQWVLRGLGLTSELPAGANLGQKVLHGLGEMGKTGLVNTVLPTGWSNTFENYQERMLQNEFDITDKGQIIFQESTEKPATAFLKSLGETFVMFASEAAGELIGLPVKGAGAAINKYAGTPIGNYIKSNKVLSEFAKKITPELSKLYEKINKLPIKGESIDWLKSQVKFDGFIEELGEEVLEDVLNLTIGTNNEERNLENYAKAIFKSPDEWAILAGAVALQGGTLSIASHLLGSHLEQNGATDEQIVEILQNLSEKEKEEMVDTLVDEGILNIEETEEQHFEKTVSSVAESLLQSGNFKDKDTAEKAVRLGATMLENMSKKTGKSLDELIQEDMAEIEQIDESAYADENGRLYASINNSPETIQDRLEALADEYSALPDDFDNQEELNRRIREIDILSRIESEQLPLEDIEFVNDMIADLEEKGDTEFAQTLRDTLNNENREVHFQKANFAGAGRDELIDAAKEWQEKGAESKYFKKWFGDSKVVDENGEPLVVYHGTNADFDTFSLDYENEGRMLGDGIYLTNSKGKAGNYGNNLMELYVNIQNPFKINEENALQEIEKRLDVSKENIQDWLNYYSGNTQQTINRLFREYNLTNKLQEKGYDGIIFNDGYEIIAFNPEQIKSVNNYGTFDSENPNIYYQRKINEVDGQMKLFQDVMQLNLFQQQQIFSSDNTKENVQQEIKQSYTEKDIKEAKQNSNYEITDVGDSLLGNLKKNKKQYSWQELSEMNDLLRKKYLTKSYIYQLPSYEEFKQEGLSDKCIAFINNVYSKINAKPAKGYEKIEHQKIYFDSVLEIMDKTISFVKGNSELIDNHSYGTDNSLFKIIFPDTENKKPYSIFRAYPEYNLKAIITGGNKLIESFYLDYKTEKNLKAISEKFNKSEPDKGKKESLSGWQKYFDIVEYRGNWVLADRKSGVIFSDRKMPTKELAEKLAENLYQFMNQNARSFEVDFSNLRNYIPRRLDNQNVKPEALIQVFGFRGINFGNWTKQSERQNFVNLAYDSLYDLAELLNLPPKALSLGGRLGLAFGAQGRSKAAGHFIPEFNEINLTRKSGAGSLAHEWWHALDFYFGDQSQDKEFSGVASLSLKNQGFLRDEVYTALMNLNEAIKYSPLTEEDFIAKKDEYRNRYERIIQYTAKDIKRTFSKSKNSNKINELVDNVVNNALTIDFQENQDDKIIQQFVGLLEERRKTFDNLSKMNSLLYQIKNLQRVDDIAKAQKKYSDYYTKATKLNDIEKGNGYWTQNTELGARAFASYILDKINQQNYKNEFLVRDEKEEKSFDLNVIAEIINAQLNGTETNKTMQDATVEWYPAQPEERTRIFKAFDDLFANLKTREENKNVILYQSENSTNKEKSTVGDSHQKSTRQNKIFLDNRRAEQILNRFEKIKGTFIPAENLITLFKDADESTIIHEFAHWWLEKLVKYSAENEEIQEDLNEIRKFLKNNGEPFTPEQHERFARGFEAYMRTGSARTNRLKKLFEDFKNALLSLYDSIKELGFKEDEIPEINNLFERLLTTENQRIQAAVFDRCNSINAQIQEIKDNQEREFAEIEEIERNNLERNLRDKKRAEQIKEYLRLAQKAASRIPKGVREYQERYKNATFQILETATGYKRQFIANPKNWEIIEQKIADLDDQITTQDGMQANWREFYADTGVSYDNDEIDGDYNLARQAFNTLTSGNYSPMNMEDEEIGRFFGMFDYLEGKVMTLKGENKSAAYEALCSLFNDIPTMPDEAMQELVDKLKIVGEKFLDQKAMEKNPSLGIPNVSLSAQLRTYITSKMHNMKAYDPESKRVIRLSQVNRLYTLLKFANSVAETKQIIRTINNHAIEQLENRQKFILHKEIQKQVRINSKLIKVGALKRGKFDWKTNTVFSELQNLNRLSLDAAQKEYQRLINADSAVLGEERESIEQNPAASLPALTEFQAILKTKFLEYKANRVRDLNLAATRSLLEDIMELKFEGRRAKNAEELKKALSRYDYETDLVRVAYLNKNDKFANYLTRWTAGDTIFTSEGTLANWESLLNHIFDKNIAQRYSLLKTEADVEVYAHRKCLEFYNKALDIYGLKNKDNSTKSKLKDLYNRALDFDNTQPIIQLFQEYEDKGHTYQFKQNTYNKDTNTFVETNIDLTHSQLITLYAWSLNPELKKRIIVQFVGEPENNDYTEFEEILNNIMFSKLSEQDKEFAQAMIDICDSMYNDTNEVFIRTTGLSLPRVENYIPSKTERIGSDLDMLHENVLRSTNPSFIKQRKTCRRIKMEPVSPLEIILPHINKTSRYIVMSEKVNFYNRIFQSPDVKAAILDIYGKKSGTKIYRVLLNQLATSTYENYARAITVGKNLMDTIASNYITSRIGGNLKVFFSQLTSIINYSENMPIKEWVKGFKDALNHPKQTVDFMFNNCEYLQARLAGNSQNEIIATITNEADKMRSWRNFCTANTKYGDIITIMFGGKPYVDYLIKQGLSQEEAFDKFVENTLRSQQSGHNSATSAWQKQAAQNALTRMVFAFNNTNFQYERKFVDSLSNYHRGHISRNEFIKAFLVYKVFNPILFSSFLTNLSILTLIQNLFGSGDDDPFITFGADALVSIALSNWKAYGLLGILANSLVAAVAATATDEKFFESGLPLITDFEQSLQKLLRGKKLETGDYIEILAGVGDYTTGVATTRLYNSLGGIGDIAQGDFGKGFLRIIGYGNYRASVAATGQEPERKKRK